VAHRDPRDWVVFEAASWALAERRMPTERVRQLWLEPLPAAIVAERLSRLPILASVPVDELFRLAGAGRQSRRETGQVLGRVGVVPEGLNVLLDGRAQATDSDGRSRPLVGPSTIGFEEFLRHRAAGEQVAASSVAVVLTIEGDELRTLLADSTTLVEGLFRTLLETGPWPLQHLTPGEPVPGSAATDTAVPSLLDKSFVLRRVPLLADVSAEEALHLAAIARHVVAQPGDVVSEQDDPPAICILLSGEMMIEAPHRAAVAPVTARAGDVVGLFETLAGVPVGRCQRIVQHTQALRIEREDLFDLIGQHRHCWSSCSARSSENCRRRRRQPTAWRARLPCRGQSSRFRTRSGKMVVVNPETPRGWADPRRKARRHRLLRMLEGSGLCRRGTRGVRGVGRSRGEDERKRRLVLWTSRRRSLVVGVRATVPRRRSSKAGSPPVP
jgi:hypothetical protein